jgi:hypothetical protein
VKGSAVQFPELLAARILTATLKNSNRTPIHLEYVRSVYPRGQLRSSVRADAHLPKLDPKLVADQLGHGLGVNLAIYTIMGLDQRLAAVNLLEESLAVSVSKTK